MAGFGYPHARARSGPLSGHKQLFLVLVALVCLTGFHACSRHAERSNAERSYVEPRLPIVGRAWVVDGDTIHVAGTRIRLEGIDAPERDQSCTDSNGKSWLCGQAATRHLRDRIRGQYLTCRPRAIDRYGRVVATCSLPDGTDLSAWLVRQGWALASGFTKVYASDEAGAKAEKRGIWAGSFIAPWEWRHRKAGDQRHGFGASQ